jgi:hypothetical protein
LAACAADVIPSSHAVATHPSLTSEAHDAGRPAPPTASMPAYAPVPGYTEAQHAAAAAADYAYRQQQHAAYTYFAAQYEYPAQYPPYAGQYGTG